MVMPKPVRLFHITAIDNLAAILNQGELLSKNLVARRNIGFNNIAHTGAQGARSNKTVVDSVSGMELGALHDYVPFYFAPRSPMLRAINGGRVENCAYEQADIVYFELLVRTIYKQGGVCVFYDRNATKAYSKAYTDLHLLQHKVAWDLLTEEPTLDGFCRYFQDKYDEARYMDRMEKRQAEFLVKDLVPLAWFTRLGVYSEVQAELVCGLLAQYHVNLAVEVMPDWYF